MAPIHARSRASAAPSAFSGFHSAATMPERRRRAARCDYPFCRSIQLGKHGVLRADGTNLFWYGRLLRLAHRTRAFSALNRVNFRLSRLRRLKYMTQFFYIVVRGREDGLPKSADLRRRSGSPVYGIARSGSASDCGTRERRPDAA